MGVFAGSGQARTFDFKAGDVGYVPLAMGHYIENTGDTMVRFIETFKSSSYADLARSVDGAHPADASRRAPESRSTGDEGAA